MSTLLLASNVNILNNHEIQYHLKSGLLSGSTALSITIVETIFPLAILHFTPPSVTPFTTAYNMCVVGDIPFHILDEVRESELAKKLTFNDKAPLLGSCAGLVKLLSQWMKGKPFLNCVKASYKTSFCFGATLGVAISILSSPPIPHTPSFVEQYSERQK